MVFQQTIERSCVNEKWYEFGNHCGASPLGLEVPCFRLNMLQRAPRQTQRVKVGKFNHWISHTRVCMEICAYTYILLE
jgi:hypothetical protein